MSTPIHPLAFQTHARIDILFGGSEAEVLQESIALTRDLMIHGMKDDQEILYINTLVSGRVFEAHERRAVRDLPKQKRCNSITLLGQSLAHQLEFLKRTILTKNIRYVILNGFEFSSLTSRHRIEIFFWLKMLRDACNASVIIFTQSGPRRYGTLGQMRFVSASYEEVGAYKRTNEDDQEEKKEKVIEIPKPKTESDLFYDKIKKDEKGEPKYFADKTKLDWLREKEAKALEAIAAQHPENETLKTKELEYENVALV